ncbi:DsbE family thiol:disulfide interchange protein [Amaricoccus tamworthensis]|uniref:DsbE family thiol:disulfide interchange protein n=1 Tax=Amaricoccus tamworthensis TaxID=57002 RepID=UPI003C7CB559
MTKRKFNPLVLLPPLLFLAFGIAAWVGLTRENPDELPSALVGRTTPSVAGLAPMDGGPVPSDEDLRGDGMKLVNFWASWCGPCRAEHPLLMELGESEVPVIGINYKDSADNAAGFLEELGNPYDSIGADADGRSGIDWGIYGVPETFVVGPDGEILHRHPGPLTVDIFNKRIRPLLEGQS